MIKDLFLLLLDLLLLWLLVEKKVILLCTWLLQMIVSLERPPPRISAPFENQKFNECPGRSLEKTRSLHILNTWAFPNLNWKKNMNLWGIKSFVSRFFISCICFSAVFKIVYTEKGHSQSTIILKHVYIAYSSRTVHSLTSNRARTLFSLFLTQKGVFIRNLKRKWTDNKKYFEREFCRRIRQIRIQKYL